MNTNPDNPSPTSQASKTDCKWFAMRATYRCEMAMKEKLEKAKMNCFIPLRAIEKKVGGRVKRVWKPEISSLIFVYAVKACLQEFKKTEPRLQYICNKNLNGERSPIIVPDKQMDAFIRLYKSGNYEITDDADIINQIQPGMLVRIKEGPFEGLIGTFQRIKGHRNKQFVIHINQVACISTNISPGSVEIYEEGSNEVTSDTGVSK